jgi:hypothetical protein
MIIFNNLDRSVSLERAILISINFCLAISKDESMRLPVLLYQKDHRIHLSIMFAFITGIVKGEPRRPGLLG